MGQGQASAGTDVISERARIVDEFGDLAQQVKAFKPTADRHEELRKLIASWYDSEAGTSSFRVEGSRYDCQIGQRGKQRKIVSLSKLVKLLGNKLFMQVAKVNISDVDAHVSVTDQVGIVSEERTGPRRVESVLRFPRRSRRV